MVLGGSLGVAWQTPEGSLWKLPKCLQRAQKNISLNTILGYSKNIKLLIIVSYKFNNYDFNMCFNPPNYAYRKQMG